MAENSAVQKNLFTVFLLSCVLLQSASTIAQTSNEQIISRAQSMRTELESRQGALLSPNNYAEGTRALKQAQVDQQTGKSSARVRKRLTQAAEFFERALKTIELAEINFSDALQVREAARDAEAFKLTPTIWAKAEESFNRAARALEKEDLRNARQYAERAKDEYAAAELQAIKIRHLSAAGSAIRAATESQTERYAPRTLERAKSLLASANSALEADRYAIEKPSELAYQAAKEAKHAQFIANLAERLKKKEMTAEELILFWEGPLRNLAVSAGIDTDFSEGFGQIENALQDQIRRIPQMEEDLTEANRQVLGLEEEIRELDEQLGGANAERSALIRRLEAQARVREQFASVANLFTPEEAISIRDGNTLLLRMVGLSFRTGSAKLDERAMNLLNKLQSALNVFPRSEIVVEGHTDTSGGSKSNMRLSEKRAEAVANFIITSLNVPSYRVKALGYGDTRPVANNKTNEGRARNRRIDILILPKIDAP